MVAFYSLIVESEPGLAGAAFVSAFDMVFDKSLGLDVYGNFAVLNGFGTR